MRHFTIAAICEPAGVPPQAIYARAHDKDALFIAIYEHGMSRVRADQGVLTDQPRWNDVPLEQICGQAVRAVAGIFQRHRHFLRAVVLISGAQPEVHGRGGRYSQELGDQFAALLLRVVNLQIDHPNPREAVETAFNAVFTSLVMRTAFGPGFGTPATGDEKFLDGLSAMVYRYLTGADPRNSDRLED